MTIYILDLETEKTAQILADEDLNETINSIADCLYNAHYLMINLCHLHGYLDYDRQKYLKALIPATAAISMSPPLSKDNPFVLWAIGERENYNYLVKLANSCFKEFLYRFNSDQDLRAEIHTITIHPASHMIEWFSLNLLPQPSETWERSSVEFDVFHLRYAKRLKNTNPVYTKREKPEWLT